MSAASLVAEVALSVCKCTGPYVETHTDGGNPALRDYPWQHAFQAGALALRSLALVGLTA